MATSTIRAARDLVQLAGKLPGAAALGAAMILTAGDLRPAEARPDDDKVQIVVTDHMTVDLHVKDEDLANVLELLSIQSQRNIVASRNVTGRVTATLYGVTFYEALDAILHVNGFGYIEQGNFIYVYTLSELEQIQKQLKQRVAKVVRLNYLNAEDARSFIEPMLSAEGQIKTSVGADNFSIPENAPVGKDDYALGATLVLIDYEENIEAMQALLDQLDTRPSQVLVEATIMQTALNEANAFGVDFSIIGNLNFTDFTGPLEAARSLLQGAGNEGVSPQNNRGIAATARPGQTERPSTLRVGVVHNDLAVFLRMLDEVTDTTILSNPKILALNRQPARVLVGRRVGYLNTTTTDTATTQTVQFLDTGTQLYFRPFVSSEGEIRMELKPQVSEAIIRDATDVSGAAVSIPDEITQEIVTNVIVRDGQTIVLGGLFRETTQLTRRQVPILGDIPLIGAAFRGHEDTTERAEIIFLITPSIVTDSFLADSAQRAMMDIERVRAGSRQGLLPWSRERMTARLNVEAERHARDGDYDRALWLIRRSLSLNPVQPDALRLRERITSEREVWPSRSYLRYSMQDEIEKRLRKVQPAPEPQKHRKPWGSTNMPREQIEWDDAPAPMEDEPRDRPGAAADHAPEHAAHTPAGEAVTQPYDDFQAGWLARFLRPDEPVAAGRGDPGDELVEDMKVTATLTPSERKAAEAVADAIDIEDGEAFAFDEAEELVLTAAEMRAWQEVNEKLITLRGQVDLYRALHNWVEPELGVGEHFGWESLVRSDLLDEAPANPLVSGDMARRVVIGSGPDTERHDNYGWIFDPASGSLWAAGFDAKGRPIPGGDPSRIASEQPVTGEDPAQPTEQTADADGEFAPWLQGPSRWIWPWGFGESRDDQAVTGVDTGPGAK